MVVGGLAFQVWPQGLQQFRVQLLGLIKNDQGLMALRLYLPHLVCQPLLQIQELLGSPGRHMPTLQLRRHRFLLGACSGLPGAGAGLGQPSNELPRWLSCTQR